MKKSKYVLIVLVLVTLTVRVYSQDDKDTQKYRLILSELSNSRCDYMICDCRENYKKIIEARDTIDKISYTKPYVNYHQDVVSKYNKLCHECQNRYLIAKLNFYFLNSGVLKFIIDSIEKESQSNNSIGKVYHKCYWVSKDYCVSNEDVEISRKYFPYSSKPLDCDPDQHIRFQVLDIEIAGLILIYNYLTYENKCCNAEISIPLFQDESWTFFVKVFTLKDIQKWLSENWGTAEEMRKKYQENPLPMYKVTQ